MDVYYEPRAYAYLQNIFLPSWDIEVEQTAYNTADTITTTSLLSAASQDFGALSQANKSPIPYRVRVGAPTDPSNYNGSSFDELIYGFLDELDCDYDADTMEFKGRGALALLVDARTTTKVPQNVDIATAVIGLVTQVGLKPIITTPSGLAGVKVGSVLKEDYVAMGRNIRVLEFIQMLIDGIGWIVRCQGQNILIGPPPDRSTVPIITKTWSAGGAITLKVQHSALHAHDIKVKVVSYLPKQKSKIASGQTPVDTTDLLTGQSVLAPTPTTPAASKVKAPAGRQSGFATGGFTYSSQQEYVFHMPGLTAAQCDSKSSEIQTELSRHEFIIDLEFSPTDVNELRTLVRSSPEFLIQMRGCTQASHNQLYHPRKVVWKYTDEGGITLAVTAVNHDVPTNTGGN